MVHRAALISVSIALSQTPAYAARPYGYGAGVSCGVFVYYSFNRPRGDGWLSWPCWLTDSGRFTHKVVTRPAISLAQDRESSVV